ncbi:MAG: DUF4190 domain-containing protein [Anaerolineales bacterium]
MNYPPPYQPAPLQNSTTAIISLIAGIAGLTIFPIIGSIVAVILGHMAKGEIARSGGTLGGGGAATAGLVLGYVGIGLSVLGLCIFGGLFAFGLCAPLLFLNSNPNSGSMLLPLLLAI